MILYPAIDMLGGKVVRLFQGDYDKQVQYGDDPAVFARLFQDAGATHLHLVDLDGAKQGRPCNFSTVRRIGAQGGLFLELGGGIRDEDTVVQCFAAGINRVILGTKALRDKGFVEMLVQTYGAESIAVGVDARDGKVAVEGWLDTSSVDSIDFCREMACIGVKNIIYTDISRDGAEGGANLAVYETLSRIEGLEITASGGVSSLQDIVALRGMGLHGAILGKALYSGAVDLREALEAAGDQA